MQAGDRGGGYSGVIAVAISQRLYILNKKVKKIFFANFDAFEMSGIL